MSDMTEEAAMKAAYEHLSASYRTDEDDFGCGWHAAMKWHAARIAELEARDGEVNIGEVKAMSWLIIQPNGRSYVVDDVNKAHTARGCGYAVQAIVDTHPPTGDAAGKDEAVCKLCRSTGPDVPCAYPTEINRQQAKRIAELLEVAHEYDRCIRHMDAGGDFYEFQAAAIASLTKTATGEKT